MLAFFLSLKLGLVIFRRMNPCAEYKTGKEVIVNDVPLQNSIYQGDDLSWSIAPGVSFIKK